MMASSPLILRPHGQSTPRQATFTGQCNLACPGKVLRSSGMYGWSDQFNGVRPLHLRQQADPFKINGILTFFATIRPMSW